MDIRVETLYKKANVRDINRQVEELYRAIAHKVLDMHGAGYAHLVYTLPDTFVAGSYENADLQLIIYSRIIERLKGDGHKVKLIKNEKGSHLRISWPSILDPSEKDRMRKIIKETLAAE